MTSVNEMYFEFGFKLMKKGALALTKFKMESDIDAAEKGKKEIMKDKDLWDEFLQISLEHNNHFLVEEQSIKCLYGELMEKVVNARFSEECRDYREENTIRGGKLRDSNQTFRSDIDGISGRKKKKQKKESNDSTTKYVTLTPKHKI